MIKAFSVVEDYGVRGKSGMCLAGARSMFVEGKKVSFQIGEAGLADALNFIESCGYSVISVLDARNKKASDLASPRAYTVIARSVERVIGSN